MGKWAYVLLFIGIARAQNSTDSERGHERGLYIKENVTCPNYNGYVANISDIEGSWKARELYLHLDSGGVQEYNTCVQVNITEMTESSHHGEHGDSHAAFERTNQTMMTPSPYYHQTFIQSTYFREHRRLRLVWDEAGNDVEYTLYFRNNSLGYWDSHGDQIGSLASSGNYKQFTGTVQVLKAVRDHLLLHFCQAPRDGNPPQLFSILLSREPRTLRRWDINAAHDLLRRKGLSVTTRRLVCGNSGGSQIVVSMLTIAAAVLVFISPATF